VILSAGLTPAWQQVLVFDAFRYGEVNRAAEAHWCASGKVFNAGIAAHRLGGPSQMLAPVGGAPAAQIENQMNDLGVPHRWIVTRAATRVCTTILDRSTGTITELVENGRPMLPDEIDAFRQAYAEEVGRADVAVLIGSLPAGVPDTLYRDLLSHTRCPAVLDFRGRGLLSLLDLKPYIVKPNREELGYTIGHPIETSQELLAAMRGLNERGAQWAVVSQGGGGPVWATSRPQTYRFAPPHVEKVVNPIGGGDAMAAARAGATREGRDSVAATRYGLGAAGANLRQLFPCRFDPSIIDALADQVRVEEVS